MFRRHRLTAQLAKTPCNSVKNAFFIVGATAVGKSELAAEAGRLTGAEVVNADAFQIYRGLDLLTAKPDAETLARTPHHLINAVPLGEKMNAEKFRVLALRALQQIEARGRQAIVAGGTGLYVKTLTNGLDARPAADAGTRAKLDALSLEELCARLAVIDPAATQLLDLKNRRRVTRALEICLLSGRPFSSQSRSWKPVVTAVAGGDESGAGREAAEPAASTAGGVLLVRERSDLNNRIDRRVEAMFAGGVVEEVRKLDQAPGTTAAQTLGLREIRQLLAGEISEVNCIAAIQQASRRYAKRQLTWFRRQTTFPVLNLSLQSPTLALEWIVREARFSFAPKG
jgi:tRNA dimethylallyltransferase